MDKIFKYRCKKADGLKKPLCEKCPRWSKLNAPTEKLTESLIECGRHFKMKSVPPIAWKI